MITNNEMINETNRANARANLSHRMFAFQAKVIKLANEWVSLSDAYLQRNMPLSAEYCISRAKEVLKILQEDDQNGKD